MFDVITENILNTVGILLLFYLTFDIKEFIVKHLTEDERFANTLEIGDYYDLLFKRKFNNILFKGFFVCLAAAFVISYALGKPSCEETDYTTQTCIIYDEDSGFTPTNTQRVGVFTTVFSYTFSVTVLSALEGKKKHQKNIYDSQQKELKI